MPKETRADDSPLAEQLDRIADLMALTLVRGLERDEQIRTLSAAGYAPSKIGLLLGIKANTVSVALTRARQKSKKTTRARRRGAAKQ